MSDKTLAVGRLFFALGMIGLGISHFIFQRFATGRAPAWPESVPGGIAWAYVSGVIVIAMGLAVLVRRHARYAALLAGSLIFLWALLRHMPVLIAGSFLDAGWTPAGKALTFVGGALAIAATSPTVGPDRESTFLKFVNTRDAFITIARVSLGTFFLITGAQHFRFTVFVASLIPQWFPGDPVFWTRFAGVALIAGGVGLLIRRSAPLAGFMTGLMVFLWFWIIHIPRTFASVSDGIAVFEALAVSGIAFVIAGYYLARRQAYSAPYPIASASLTVSGASPS